MLVFSAIVPHSLDLLKIPKKAPATIDALAVLQNNFAAAKPDVTVVISPHGTVLEKAFAVNLAEAYELDLLEMGVKVPKRTLKSDPLSVMAIKKAHETDSEVPVTLVSSPRLDYGAAVPLYFLFGKNSETPIIPLSSSYHSFDIHYQFGNTLKEVIMGSPKRFAVIASAALAHGKEGKSFDESIIASLQSDAQAKNLVALSDDERKKFDACGVRSLAMLMGVVEGLPWAYEQLSYEYAFDIGLLVATLTLKA